MRVVRKTLRSPILTFSIIVLIGFLFASIFPDWLTTRDPNKQNLLMRLKPPGFDDSNGNIYLLGTDHLGRDVYSRVIHGARISLIVGIIAAIVSAFIGTIVGLISGYKGGWISDFLMRMADVQLAFPFFLLAITIASMFRPSVIIVIVILALGNWVPYA